MSRWLMLAVAAVCVATAAALFLWLERNRYIPEVVATHWGWQGQPDAFTARDALLPYLFLPPAVMVFILGLAFVLPWLSPQHFKVDSFRPVFDQIMALVILLFGYLHALLLVSYVWNTFNPTRSLVSGLFLFFALLGTLLGRIKRNFWMGVRTPWTLANDEVWKRTHHLAAWLFGGAGIVGFLIAVVGGPLLVCLALILAAALTPVVYSLLLYKRLERNGQLPNDTL